MKSLKVYYKDQFAGILSKTVTDEYTFIYDSKYLTSSYPSISLTLPKSENAFSQDTLFYFFDGLIPEGWLLKIASETFKYNPLKDRFELLEKLCHDCIGAVSIGTNETTQAKTFSPIKVSNVESKLTKVQKCLICYEASNSHYHEKCSKEFFGKLTLPILDIDQSLLEKLAKEQINKHLSVTGVQKKLSLDFADSSNPDAKVNRLTLSNLWGRFIFKPTAKAPHLASNEHLCMKLAELSGIKVAQSTLIWTKDNQLAFISKRFDRSYNFQKFHQEDFCQILEKEPYKKYSSSIEQIGKVIKNNCDFPGDNLYRLLELTVFNYLIGNVDAHLKNFSLTYESFKDSYTQLSPAYDLLSTDLYLKDNEESALAINGKKNKLTKNDFLALTNYLEIHPKVLDNIIKKFRNLKPKWFKLIKKSFLSENDKDRFIQLIDKKFDIFKD